MAKLFHPKQWLLNQLVIVDLAVNSFFGGSPYETISSRLGKAHRGDYSPTRRKIALPFYYVVNWFFRVCFKQENHCYENIIEDRGAEASYRPVPPAVKSLSNT